MGQKQSIEDEILKKLGRMLFWLVALPAYAVIGYFAPFVMLIGPLAGIVYFLKKGRVDDLIAPENREMLGHAITALVGGIVISIVITRLLSQLSGFAFLGKFAPFSVLIGVLIGFAYFIIKGRLLKKGRIYQLTAAENRKMFLLALFSLFRGIVVGTVIAAAIFAPMRGLGFLVAKFSGSARMIEIFEAFSGNGVIDAWLGLIGVVFTIPAGFAAWHQAFRMRTQIANIPTSKVHAAALGLAEFKGIAREIEDTEDRMREIVVDNEKQTAMPKELQEEDAESAILFDHWEKRTEQGPCSTEIRSRFYLEDETGRILVDPRKVWFWNGEVEFFSPSARSIYLENRCENRSVGDKLIKVRRLNPGDEIYVIGSVEELEDVSPTASGTERLVLRPSSTLKSTNLLRRIILGHGKKTSRADIYDVFFLTDIKELNAAEVLTKGIGSIWLWVGVMVCLSVPLLVEYWEKLFDWRGLVEIVSIL